MKSKEKQGINRTGIYRVPKLSKEMLVGTEDLTLPRCPKGTFEAIGDNRASYMNKKATIGSVPVSLSGNSLTPLLDRLGERLAFERTGIRLYDALMSKFMMEESDIFSIASLERLEEIRAEELSHFTLLSNVIRQLGADPTAMTPAADLTGVNSSGLQKTLVEPRVGFVQSLDAILIAELADNEGWNLVIQLTMKAGLHKFAEQFEQAYYAEQEHLVTIRQWVQSFNLQKMNAGMDKAA